MEWRQFTMHLDSLEAEHVELVITTEHDYVLAGKIDIVVSRLLIAMQPVDISDKIRQCIVNARKVGSERIHRL